MFRNSDNNEIKSLEHNTFSPAQVIDKLSSCTKYTFAVALNHKKLKTQLYLVTDEVETGGRRQPNKPLIINNYGDTVVWKEDKSNCASYYKVTGREVSLLKKTLVRRKNCCKQDKAGRITIF